MTRPGPDGRGYSVCRFCTGPTPPGTARCYCCAVLARQLRMPPVPVVAAAWYRTGDQVHGILRGYKDAPLAEARAAAVVEARVLLAGVADRLEQGGPGRRRIRFDAVVTVPSTRRRGRPPVDRLIEGVPALRHRLVGALVRGPAPLDHLVASADGFAVTAAGTALRGRRVLLVDDSYTTGARAQSAAAALRAARVHPVAVAVAGRVVAPGATRWCTAFWSDHLAA